MGSEMCIRDSSTLTSNALTLRSHATADGGYFEMLSGSSGTGLVIDDSNNVGVGTISPEYPLHVNGTLAVGLNTSWGEPLLQRHTASTDYFSIGFSNGTSSGSTNTERALNISRTGAIAIGTTGINNNYALSVFRDPAANQDVALNVYLNNTNSSSIVANFGNGQGDGMVILGDGDVGIGTHHADADSKLHINASNACNLRMTTSGHPTYPNFQSNFFYGAHHIDVYSTSSVKTFGSTSNGVPMYLNYYSGGNVRLAGGTVVTLSLIHI